MASPSVLEIWQLYKADRAPSVQPTTLATDYSQVEKWLIKCPVKKGKKGREVVAWTLSQQPSQSARKVVGYVRSMYKWASSDTIRLLDKNPVKEYSLPKMPQRDEEVSVIPRHLVPIVLSGLERQRNRGDANWKLYSDFMLQTGMRTGEVRASMWSDIKDGCIAVHQNYTLTHGLKNSTKTNRKRKVPLNQKAKDIIEQLPRQSEFIFPWDRNAYQSFFRRRMQMLKNNGEIDCLFRPYDLRHTAISRWLEEGIPVTSCARWAGNTPEIIWKFYANSTQEFEMPVV